MEREILEPKELPEVVAPGRPLVGRGGRNVALMLLGIETEPTCELVDVGALPSGLPRLISIGRLDLNSEGLLLLTNDGGIARRLELPATGWVRRYKVRVHGFVDAARLTLLTRGITVDGVAYGPIRAQLERQQGSNAWITLSLQEGRNREVRRVLEHLGYPVTRLIRLAYGPFQLGHLARGAIAIILLTLPPVWPADQAHSLPRDQAARQLARTR